MSRIKSTVSEFIKYHLAEDGSYSQNSDTSVLPYLSQNMTQALLESGLCSSVDTKRQGFVMPFWSAIGRVENKDLGMLFDIDNSMVIVDGFKSSRIKNSNFKNVNCYATTSVWCGYSASPVLITAQTSQHDYHPSTESIRALVLKSLVKLAIQSYVMQAAYNSRYSWNNAWANTPDETSEDGFVLSFNCTTDKAFRQSFMLDADLNDVAQDDGSTKSILSVSLTNQGRDNAMDDMHQLAIEITSPLQNAGYKVSITANDSKTLSNKQKYTQELKVSIDVTDDITDSTSQANISECRFLHTLETILRETVPSGHKPMYILDEQREFNALERIASDNDEISQEYHKQAMDLAEKTIHVSTGHQYK